MKLKDLQETASAGATGAGNIATSTAVPNEKVVSADANDVGMFPIVRRNPKKKIKKNVSESQILNEFSIGEIIEAMRKKGIPVDRAAIARLMRLRNLGNISRSVLKQAGLGDLIGGDRPAESVNERRQYDKDGNPVLMWYELEKKKKKKSPDNATSDNTTKDLFGKHIKFHTKESEMPIYSGEVFMVINNEDALNLILQKVGDKIQRHENNIIVVDQGRADKIEKFLHTKGYDKGEDYMVMQKEQNINEGVLDSVDDEGVLVKAQLYSLAKRAIELHQMLTDTDEIEGWIQSHIAVANDNILSVYQYMDYEAETLEEPAPAPAPEIEAVDIVDELPPVEMESIDPSIAKRWDKIVVNATKELESA
jgi:hypothetical protein